MPLSEKVRVEVFIPDLPDPIYHSLLDELEIELSYAFGGCTVVAASGKYRSVEGLILPNRINILFSDAPFLWERDRLVVTRYVELLRIVAQQALEKEETVLISVYPVYHGV